MKITNLAIEKVKPYYRNAKIHPADQVKAIARSIAQFGFNQPIVVDKDYVVIAGHGRLEAARSLEMKEVPVYVVDLSPAQAKAYRLADNKTNESSWNDILVVQELLELKAEDFDVSLTGFDESILEASAAAAEDGEGGDDGEKVFEVVVAFDNVIDADELTKELKKRGLNVKLKRPD